MLSTHAGHTCVTLYYEHICRLQLTDTLSSGDKTNESHLSTWMPLWTAMLVGAVLRCWHQTVCGCITADTVPVRGDHAPPKLQLV